LSYSRTWGHNRPRLTRRQPVSGGCHGPQRGASWRVRGAEWAGNGQEVTRSAEWRDLHLKRILGTKGQKTP